MHQPLEPIAIIGIAGRFPGAVDTQQLWRNLLAEEEGVRFPSEDDLLSSGVSRGALADPSYVRAVAEPDGIDTFDAEFFGLTRREAELCDPQLRLYLETSHAAVENAGYDPSTLGRAGVFASVAANRYWAANFDGPLDALRSATGMSTGMWNNPESAATLVSYKLNLRGPSMTVQTACSSSLVAVHLAVNALRLNECDVALAGGADVELPLGHGYWWAQDGPLSRDGRCRPFDAAASGTIFGSGVGVVVLKRLTDAVADRDHIYATVRAVAVNNDGSGKVGFTAPSARGQADVVLRAMELAGVGPEDIGYVEAHATGTRLGDPVEVAALTEAFRARTSAELAPRSCPIGSVKGNVGHLGHAAGITSMIKVALSLDAEQIPASINCAEENPLLDLEDSPFAVNDTARPWPRSAGRRRLAGVSSFGIGGTNSHAIVEEAPGRPAGATPDGAHVLVWSARTPSAAEAYRERLTTFVAGSDDTLSGVAFTLQNGRTAHPFRGAVVAEDLGDAAAALRDPRRRLVSPDEGAGGSVVFLFPGQGAQHPRMAWELYRTEPLFSAPFDECLDLFDAQGLPIRQTWRGESGALDDTIVAQPLLFSVEYALGRMWMALGVEPDALLGHSVGEIAAATIAGVFTLPDAVHLVGARARAMSESPAGAMVAVAADADSVSRLLSESLAVAVVNSDRQTVVAGSPEDVRLLEEALPGAGLRFSRLSSPHAFHTAAMLGAAERFRSAFNHIEPLRPRKKLYSAAAGGLVDAAQVWDPDFWARQLAEPVRFARALDAVLSDAGRVLVEVGPGRTLTTLAQGHPQLRAKRHAVVPTLPGRRSDPGAERSSMLQALARMWTLGKDVDWSALSSPSSPRRIPLPGYPYERTRHWARKPPANPAVPVVRAARADARALLRLPTWVEDAPAGHRVLEARNAGRVLVFLPDDGQRVGQVASHLHAAGLDALMVRHGPEYSEASDWYVVRPHHPADVVRLLEALRDRGRYPDLIVDAMTLGDLAKPDLDRVDRQIDAGFHRIVALLQEAARCAPDKRGRHVLVMTENSADVTGAETVHPVRAMLHGLARTYLLENPHATCKLVDVGDRVPGDQLVAELRDWARSGIVAMRGDRRWVPGERELVAEAGPVDLRRHGVYVITGGLGGLGLAVARGLAATELAPRLVLLGRHVRAEHGEDLAEIRALGAECRVEQCDVTDVNSLRRTIDQASADFGPINGVLHLAGVPGEGMLQFRTREQMSATLAPKIHGTLALVEVLKGRRDLDFFVSFSSRAALSGLIGSADYAAANAFLDAVVRQQPLAGCHSMSINWPSWAAVGMAARQADRPQGETAGSGPGWRRWSTTLSVDDYPILDEHRLDGVPVLPGTAQVDFVLRAFHAEVHHNGGCPVQLRNVVFREPITAEEAVSLEVVLEPQEDQWRFSVRSAPLSPGSPGTPGAGYHVHTTGEIHVVDARADWVDVDELLSSLPGRRTPLNESAGRLFTIGPRWPKEEVCFSTEETGRRLVALTFPAEFEHELDTHALHPTLLDAAVSSARDSDHELPHAPFGYESIVVHRPVPSFAYSYVRRRPSGTDTIVADVDVLMPTGEVAVGVRGFTMRRVDESMVAGVTARQPRDSGPDDAEFAGYGIRPEIGVELLLLLLGQPGLRQVAVTLPGEDSVLKQYGREVSEAGDGRTVAPAGRPAQSEASATDPVDGASDGLPVEARLRAMWSAAFGVEQVGLDDDFFELGGDSLTAVGLMDEIRKEFGLEIGIAAIFDHRTVTELAAEVGRLKE